MGFEVATESAFATGRQTKYDNDECLLLWLDFGDYF
jgi:hypothetical protein